MQLLWRYANWLIFCCAWRVGSFCEWPVLAYLVARSGTGFREAINCLYVLRKRAILLVCYAGLR